ncbi:MAG: hypothetical protein IPL86_15665 [Flavobacteriales bacterium]|nr:hypothetical protein [Flavobacteriales bacterium]
MAVSAVTTFTTPYMVQASGPFAGWLEHTLPKSWTSALDRYGQQARIG